MVTSTVGKMTAQEARTFGRFSVANAVHVRLALQCGCQPYEDVYTYNRWKAQGYQVQHGEKAITLPVIKMIEHEDKETGEITTRRLLGSGAVFCRHQVKEVTP